MTPVQSEKADRFRSLHEGEPFVIPNPWDGGSARMLESLGFQALATTSSGFAFTLGRKDGQVTLDELAAHVALICSVTAVPVAVDLEDGYGPDPGAAITRMAEAGAVGASIEDFGRDSRELYDVGEAVERLGQAVQAARALDFPFTLAARSENQLHGDRDLDQTIARLQAYEEVGPDVVYAPGLRTVDEIRAVRAGTTKPLNVLGHRGLSLDEIVGAGAQRISVGGALTWVAAGAMRRAAEPIRDSGDFSVLSERPPLAD
jgi:2-methylisocitrate lyase-like PEP mutase family enzyme